MNQFQAGLLKYLSENDLKKMNDVTIGIAGVGGLGSNCAGNLVRLGFTKFLLVDFDRVDSSNLNRQFFFEDQIGMLKTDALKDNLLRINGDLLIELNNEKLNRNNITEIFSQCSIVVEALDHIDVKKMALEYLCRGDRFVVSASGLGSGGNTDGIKSRTVSDSLVLVGDGKNCIEKGSVPLSPGVNVAAAKQAGAIVNHVLGRKARRSFGLPEIYGLTYSECSAGRSTVEVVKEMIKAGIKLIQYREKEKCLGEKYGECLKIRELTSAADVLFIVNDHIDLAMMVNADGIHLGQDDIPISAVRALVGEEMLIGWSTHSPQQALLALQSDVDYIGVGPIFATKTKKNVCDPVGYEYLQWVANNIDIPFVAIGGIKKHNLHEIVRRGASSVALVSEITGNENIPGLVGEIRKIIEENRI